jgi:hypothetical protein
VARQNARHERTDGRIVIRNENAHLHAASLKVSTRTGNHNLANCSFG